MNIIGSIKQLLLLGEAVSMCVCFTSISKHLLFFQIFYSHKVSLEVIAEKIVVSLVAKDLLLLQVAHDKLLHLLFIQHTITVKLADLQKITSGVLLQLILMLNHFETCLKHSLVFLNMANFNLTLNVVILFHLILDEHAPFWIFIFFSCKSLLSTVNGRFLNLTRKDFLILNFWNLIRTWVALLMANVVDNNFRSRAQQWAAWFDVLSKQSIVLADVIVRQLEPFLLVVDVFFSSFLQSFVFDKIAWIVALEDRPRN